MQRQSEKQSVVWSTVMGFVLLGGVIPVAAADDTKKPAEQAAPAAKKTPEKKATAKSGSQKAKPAATAQDQAPKYTSAETAAKAQACFGEAPKIQSVTPDEAKAGEKVKISGRGFGPADLSALTILRSRVSRRIHIRQRHPDHGNRADRQTQRHG